MLIPRGTRASRRGDGDVAGGSRGERTQIAVDGPSPLAVWPLTLLDWPFGAGPALLPPSARTFAFFYVFLLFSGNLGRAFFPMLFYLLMEPDLMRSPGWRKFCGDSDEAVGSPIDEAGPYTSGYRNHEVANEWVSQDAPPPRRMRSTHAALTAPPLSRRL